MFNSKFLGGILLIVGTSIGGGMLALPVSTAAVGPTNTIFFLVMCWLVMTAGALLILEVNLRLPSGSNMVTMARQSLGLPGQIVAWITYLFLLYTLLAGYIAGGSDIFAGILQNFHCNLPPSLTALLFTFLFGFIIYNGIHTVDYVNRGFMFGKLGVYLLLVLIIMPHISPMTLAGGSAKAITGSLMILITSFGFASIVPSLREYFKDDTRSLRFVILLGSLIPLICYILWDIAIMGVVDRTGLISLTHSEHAANGLTIVLGDAIHNKWIMGFFAFFSAICMVTAFLGVSLGLFDFLADGLKLKKKGSQGRFVLASTFLPPLLIVLIKPGIYLQALSYAGVCCVILLLLLPILMAWRSRRLTTNHKIMVPGGNVILAVLAVIALVLLGVAWFS